MKQALKPNNNLQQLKMLLDSLPNMIALVDASMRYRLINSAYTEYFGNTEQELVGKYASEVLGKTYASMLERYMAHALKGKSTTWVINRTSESTGESLLSIKLQPYPAGSKAARNMLFVAEDITETVKLHQKLAAFKEAREHRLVKSTQELDNTIRSTEYHALKLDDSHKNDEPFQASIKRRVFASQVSSQLAHMKDDGGHKAFLIFTIKNYASIIYQHGELAGRTVLNHFADRLDTLLHDSVQIGQINKERVAIAIPRVSLETAQSFGQLISHEMKNCEIKYYGQVIGYSVYAGATGYKPFDIDTGDIKQQANIENSSGKIHYRADRLEIES